MSGEHRGGGRRTDGEYDARGGGYRAAGGHASGGHPTGEYASGGYGSGGYPTGEYSRDAYPSGGYSGGTSSGGYPSGGYPGGAYPSGGYPGESGGGYANETYSSGTYTSGGYRITTRTSGPYGTRTSGEYGTRTSGEYGTRTSGEYGTRTSGEYGTRSSGDYGLRSEYGSTSGEYRRPGSSRTSPGSGGYRSTTGSHRIVRERRGPKRLGLLLTSVVAGVAACVLAAFVVLGGTGSEDDQAGGQTGAATAGGTPSSRGERSIVPDACELLPQQIADRLAPKADRTPADNYQSSDRQNQCVWGVYNGKAERQLTIELRAIEARAGRGATDAARATFATERSADESGKSLLAGQELAAKSALAGVADEGYIVYLVNAGQGAGEAVANVRMANVLITIHYSGSDDGDPLGRDAAVNGATEAAKAIVQALTSAG